MVSTSAAPIALPMLLARLVLLWLPPLLFLSLELLLLVVLPLLSLLLLVLLVPLPPLWLSARSAAPMELASCSRGQTCAKWGPPCCRVKEERLLGTGGKGTGVESFGSEKLRGTSTSSPQQSPLAATTRGGLLAPTADISGGVLESACLLPGRLASSGKMFLRLPGFARLGFGGEPPPLLLPRRLSGDMGTVSPLTLCSGKREKGDSSPHLLTMSRVRAPDWTQLAPQESVAKVLLLLSQSLLHGEMLLTAPASASKLLALLSALLTVL